MLEFWAHSEASGEQNHCLANMAYVRQSEPDFGIGLQVKVLRTCQVGHSSLGSGWWVLTAWRHAVSIRDTSLIRSFICPDREEGNARVLGTL
jgi:hypothetical protein